MTENIWDESAIEKLGGEYNKLYNSGKNDGFSWVLDEDAKVLNLKKEKINNSDSNKKKAGKLNLNMDKTSVNLGLPSQVHGDAKNAKFFLCLLNPRVQDSKKLKEKEDTLKGKNMSIEDYKNIENKNDDEYFEDLNKYYTHIKDEQNILAKEYIYAKNNSDSSDDSLYYLSHYYYFMFEKKEEQGKKGAKEKGINTFLSKNKAEIEELDICNLELFPYRAESKPKGGLFKSEKTYKDLESSKYVANIILDRVKKANSVKKSDKNSEDTPIFVFRSYGEWFEVLLQEFAKRKGFKKIDEEPTKEKGPTEEEKKSKNIEEKENLENIILKQYLEATNDYFYEFPNQNAALTKNNLKSVLTGEKISNDNYEKIQNIFKLD
jgi:hypothetical protein